jgi:hypothetical protein
MITPVYTTTTNDNTCFVRIEIGVIRQISLGGERTACLFFFSFIIMGEGRKAMSAGVVWVTPEYLMLCNPDGGVDITVSKLPNLARPHADSTEEFTRFGYVF